MSTSDVDRVVAKALVKSLLQRFSADGSGNYKLNETISADEFNAIALLVGAEIVTDTKPKQPTHRFGAPAIISSNDLELTCLDAGKGEGDILAIDFGTAFSKAALWRKNADEPSPLDLLGQVSDRHFTMLESSVYITDGTLHFGPRAESVFRQENDPTRSLFSSPKQELSILAGSYLDQNAPVEVDPTSTLKKSDLLTLYLSYLTAATSSALEQAKVDRHTIRRYAMPVWEGDKLKTVSRVLRRQLVDAQILADSVPMDAWARGLSVADAERLLRKLRETVSDGQRDGADFIEGHVLEAAAAAAAIGEKLSNRRPVAMVMDVGAGTTDVGVYAFALPKNQKFKIFPFQGARGACRYAGNDLDSQLIQFIKERVGFDESSQDGKRMLTALYRDVREFKATMFSVGFADIEVLDGRRFERDEFVASKQASAFKSELKRKITGYLDEVGAERMRSPDGLHGVITGGGANASIFREIFDEPFKLADGDVKFAPLDVEPAWVPDYQPDIRPVFPQLAVSVGACSPDLPDERNPITDASTAPRRTAEISYRG